MLVIIAVAIASLPLIYPKGPANSAPVDLLMGLSVLAMLGWAARFHGRIRLPYAVPTLGLVLVGLASALASEVPASGAKAVSQELFLLLWCAAITTVCRSAQAIAVVLRTWAISATAWAGLLILAVLTGQTAISGATGEAGTRARLLFDHPNMAGNYFMIAVFVVVASGFPRRLPLRVGACLTLVLAMFLTGSNAALLSLMAGGLVTVFLHLRARKGMVAATAVVAMTVAGGVLAWSQVVAPLVAAAQQSDNSMLRYSIGRGARSADARTDLFANQYELYESGHLLGIGPAGTKEALGEAAAPAVKEAHNDYLGTLVERGPFGALALAGLVATVFARLTRITRRPLHRRLRQAVPVPAALAGACAAFALTAVTHEILHYRWFWALLGVIAALTLLAGRDHSAATGTGPTAELPSEGVPAGFRDG